ncbi:hypothetical protein NDU88_002311 [Pleurodeles waltl]|uniref:Uncharacterized protein n=1 Tax=Pleurodeles waltl TaxID=8319 RepID=A0AAV7T1R7_PLEWA|nr:hypothetical protein NDU88_002311 [Pleurodeles waltl]
MGRPRRYGLESGRPRETSGDSVLDPEVLCPSPGKMDGDALARLFKEPTQPGRRATTGGVQEPDDSVTQEDEPRRLLHLGARNQEDEPRRLLHL